jgi:hypothetical protein
MPRRHEHDFNVNHPIHDAVFGASAANEGFGEDPDGMFNDTPRGAIGENVNMLGSASQPEGFKPMRHLGKTDQGERQPLGGRRQ